MQIADSVILVTGANRGIGLAFAREALDRGARRVAVAGGTGGDGDTEQLPGVPGPGHGGMVGPAARVTVGSAAPPPGARHGGRCPSRPCSRRPAR